MSSGRTLYVLSMTPTAAAEDTRTMKIACAFRDFGWRSAIMENKPSYARRPLDNIEIISMPALERKRSETTGNKSASPSREGSALGRGLRERLHFVRFILLYYLVRPLQCAWRLKNADIIYLHEYRLFPIISLARRMGLRAPLIYDAHDYYPDVYRYDHLSSFWRRHFLPMLIRLEEKCIADAKAMVVVADGIAKLYERKNGITPTVIMNSYDSGLEESVKSTVRSEIGLAETDYLFVCIGNRKPGMAIDNVISALARFPSNVHLAIIGSFHETTRKYADGLQLSNRVHILGRKPSGQIVPFVKSADCAVVPYTPETSSVGAILPNGFFQSVAASLPLIYPPLGDIRNVVSGKPVGVEADAASVDQLFDGMQELVRSRGQSGKYISAVKQLSEDISWKTEKQKLSKIVENIL